MPAAPSPWRPAFLAALRLLARVSEAMVARGFLPPVLVGGGAVEVFSSSMIATGDIDVAVIRQDVFEEELKRLGFVRPSGPGVATRGWIHPELALGFEVVSDRLLDGMADRDRVRIFAIGDSGNVQVIAVEDIIADRVGQFSSGTAPDMLEQARMLGRLFVDLDFDYMERRIREETANSYGVDILTA